MLLLWNSGSNGGDMKERTAAIWPTMLLPGLGTSSWLCSSSLLVVLVSLVSNWDIRLASKTSC